MKQPIFLFFIITLLTGCNAYEKVAYMQQAGMGSDSVLPAVMPVPEPVIKVGDVLVITVNAMNPESALPFNLPLVPSGESSRSYSAASGNLSYGLSLQNYLVDTDGDIVFPVIGKMQVVGMTKTKLADKIKANIFPRYITEEPIILVRYANFKVSVLGEVLRPGSFVIDNEKISILEALAQAGDMTIYGRRESVLLVREQQGFRESVRIDLRDKNLANSPYFYLQQGDVIYVEPNDSRARSSAISSAESLSISIVGTLISLTTLLINIIK